MTSFEHYFSDEKIISILCKIRLKNAQKRHEKQFYRNISSQAPNPNSFSSPVDTLFPPRKQWCRPNLKERLNKNKFQINLLALKRTIGYRIKSGFAKNEDWYKKLTAFIKRVQSLALQDDDYKISKPCVYPIEKDEAKKTYRLISNYKVLEDKVILGLTARYFRDIFDEYFLDCSYAFRGRREASQKIPTHHTAVQNLIDYLKNHEGKLLYVAECDIQKFFDVIHHEVSLDSFNRAVKRATDGGVNIDKRAIALLKLYLSSYTFPKAKKEAYKLLKQRNIEEKITWAEEGLQRYYDKPSEEKIGVPQGGALSQIIANLVLDDADREVIFDLENPDPDLFYARYCDDMIIIHTDQRKCQEAFGRYLRALDTKRLPVDEPVLISEYGKGYYDKKSKRPFAWGEPKGRKEIVPWISFLGSQVRFDGKIRVRRKSLKKELEKQVGVVDRVINHINSNEKVLNKSKEQILHQVKGKLIAMSVGRIRLGSENQSPQFCWTSGFQLLREYNHIPSQLKQLDRNRERQISRLKRRLNVEPEAKTKKQKLPKYHGAPFSYYSFGDSGKTSDAPTLIEDKPARA